MGGAAPALGHDAGDFLTVQRYYLGWGEIFRHQDRGCSKKREAWFGQPTEEGDGANADAVEIGDAFCRHPADLAEFGGVGLRGVVHRGGDASTPVELFVDGTNESPIGCQDSGRLEHLRGGVGVGVS